MNAEITRQVFYTLIAPTSKVIHTEKTEHYNKTFYRLDDRCTVLFIMENFVSGVTQYFIQDINA